MIFTFCVSAGCHINDVMNKMAERLKIARVSAGCHINDVMNVQSCSIKTVCVSAGCHINDVMNFKRTSPTDKACFSWMSYQ